MSILDSVSSIFHFGTTLNEKNCKNDAAGDKKSSAQTALQEDSYTSKKAADAVSNNAIAGINLQPEARVRTCNTINLTGKLFPDFDQKEITQDYLKLREEAKQKAVQTTRKLYRTFTTGDLSDLKDKNGNVIATFSIPKNKDGEFDADSDFCSYKMTEYDPKTKEVVAVTRVFNHDGFNKQWKKHYAPYMERIEFGKKPEDTTFLKVTYTNKEVNGKYTLYSTVQTYAKGYETDDKVTGIRKADKFISKQLHQDYESYRTNYEAPARIFNGCLYSDPPSIIEQGGMLGEKFDSALEYPQRQFKLGDEIFIFNPYYVNEKGNRTKEN